MRFGRDHCRFLPHSQRQFCVNLYHNRMNHLYALWAFTRPHTIIGSAVSISALYLMGKANPSLTDHFFWLTLISALLCNLFITGYNQITDVELDRINKPFLPLASGALSMKAGKGVVGVALVLSLGIALYLSPFLFGLIAAVSLLGFLYSWKGIYLKSHHSSAAGAITIVRGVLVNIGFYLFFSGLGFRLEQVPAEIWLLTVFITLFSLGIAWFKDIPDVRGDAGENLRTLAIRYGVFGTYRLGTYMVIGAYVIAVFAPLLIPMNAANPEIISIGHILLGASFTTLAFRTNPDNQMKIRRFYKAFWVLFFLEYLLFVLAFEV